MSSYVNSWRRFSLLSTLLVQVYAPRTCVAISRFAISSTGDSVTCLYLPQGKSCDSGYVGSHINIGHVIHHNITHVRLRAVIVRRYDPHIARMIVHLIYGALMM